MGSAFHKPAAVAPQCASPVPFEPRSPKDAAPGYIVMLAKDVRVSDFVQQHGIATINLFQFINGFYAELTPERVAELRCNPAVTVIEQNAFGQGGALTAPPR